MEAVKKLEVGGLQTPANTVSPSSSVSKILGIFKDLPLYEVFLTVGDKVGMITMRDILGVSNLTSRKTSSLITYVPKLSPQSRVGEVARIMTEYRVRALPVVEGDNITGVVTSLSIIEAAQKSLPELKAKHVMTAQPITIFENDKAAKARNIMVRRKVDHLPVMSMGKKLNGILASSNLVLSMIPPEAAELGAMGVEAKRRFDFPVKDIMDLNVSVCNLNDKLSRVLNRFLEKKQSYLAVTLWDELQGIITHRDAVKLIAEPFEKAEVPVYMVGLPEDPFEAEVAKTKFIKTVNMLQKSLTYIEEARSIIKRSAPTEKKERIRYEVKVAIKTPRRGYNFSETGWDLLQIYDQLSNRMKRIVTKKLSKKKPKTERFTTP